MEETKNGRKEIEIADIPNRNSNPYPEQKLAQTASDSLTGEGKSSTEQTGCKGSNDTKSNTEESKSQEAQPAKLKNSTTTDGSGSNPPTAGTP